MSQARNESGLVRQTVRERGNRQNRTKLLE
jgi:hypothetical protein